METGVNQYLLERAPDLMAMPYEQAMAELRGLMDRLPSQASVRTQEQLDNQQFSTPPTESYTVARVANLKPEDVVLEPSAGNGGLAVWPKAIGAQVFVNEISERRRAMLDLLSLGPASAVDGELIHTLLDPTIKPTVVLMNPPFSASTQKSHAAPNRTQYGLNHLDQALQRLEPNGRLVAILGGGHANDVNGGASLTSGPSGKWFDRIAQLYHVRANVRVSGKEYRKYGTTFATRIIVIDKDGPTPSQVTPGQPKSWTAWCRATPRPWKRRTIYLEMLQKAARKPSLEPLTVGRLGRLSPEAAWAQILAVLSEDLEERRTAVENLCRRMELPESPEDFLVSARDFHPVRVLNYLVESNPELSLEDIPHLPPLKIWQAMMHMQMTNDRLLSP